MKANKYISVGEHKSLLCVSFIAFVFVLLIFVSDFYNINTDSSSIFPQTNYTLPGLHFFTLFIFLALLKTKRFLLSSLLTAFYAVVFIYALSLRYDGARLGGEEFSPKVDFLDKVYRAATDYDYIAAIFISILLFWQISILLRMLIKTLQKENVLP
jgi:hypothetical protein